MRARSLAGRVLAASLLSLSYGCGSNESTGTTTGTLAVTVSPTSATIVQGGSTIITGSVTRGGGFTGDVGINVTGAPDGVSGTVTQAPASGSSSLQVTLSVPPSVTPGTYPLTVHATGSGVTEATASFALTVSAAAQPSFTMAVTPASISVAQGASATSVVSLTRTGGFTGAVTFAVTTTSGGALPAGLTAAVTPTATADSYTLTATSSSALAAGVYNVLVTASSAGVTSRTATVPVTVTSSGSLVRFDYSACDAAFKPSWFAYQDGTGAWTTVTPTAGVYQFNVASPTGAYTYVTTGTNSFATHVTYFAQSDIPTLTNNCGSTGTPGKTVNGTFTGITAADRVFISFDGISNVFQLPASTFQYSTVASGPWDFIAYRRNGALPGSDRMLIRRDQNPADGGTFAPIDFNGAEAVPAATASLTLSGVAPTDPITQSMSYYTGASCNAAAILYLGFTSTGPNAVANGWPSTAPQRATDLHSMSSRQTTAPMAAVL